MVEKNKNNKLSQFGKAMSHTGMVVMLAATMISMAEIAEREGNRVVATLQPAYAYSNQTSDIQGHGDEQRRGKEEICHASASYGTLKRSHSVTGTL